MPNSLFSSTIPVQYSLVVYFVRLCVGVQYSVYSVYSTGFGLDLLFYRVAIIQAMVWEK